jgi:hypothetical protein
MALGAFALLTVFAVLNHPAFAGDATLPLFVKQKRGIVVEAATTLTQAAGRSLGERVEVPQGV